MAVNKPKTNSRPRGQGSSTGKMKKSTKRFQAKQLGSVIKARKKAQDFKRKVERRQNSRHHGKGKGKGMEEDEGAGTDGGEDDDMMDVDRLLEGDFSDDEIKSSTKEKGKLKAISELQSEEEEDEEEDEDLSDLPDVEASHVHTLKSLATKDPEFYKYLQENDADLLNFGLDGSDEEEEEGDEETFSKTKKRKRAENEEQILNLETVRNWQRSILKTRSLKSLRALLQAFRSASLPTNTSQPSSFVIQSPVVYTKVVRTSLSYTPLVLSTHYPLKTLSSGRISVKQNTHTTKIARSYFTSLLNLWPTLSDVDLKRFAIQHASTMTGWMVGGRNRRDWIRLLVESWSSEGEDELKVVALVAIRKLLSTSAGGKLREEILGTVYAALVSRTKKTNVHTLPQLNLMKNSAAELFAILSLEDDAFKLAYGYIRQLALVLRQAIQGKQKDVYTWQIAHSIDFWSIVLSIASDNSKEATKGSKIDELLYPLVQVGMGMMRLVPTSRYHPFRLHIINSFLRLVQRTGTFIPIAPFIMFIFNSPEVSNGKNSTLKPLPFNYVVKAPVAYSKTRVYGDGLVEEATYLMSEYLATLSCNIAFPELVIPVLISLRKQLKKTRNPKYTASVKPLVEKIEATMKWVEEKRLNVEFGPKDRSELEVWRKEEEPEKSPLGIWVKTIRKQRRRREETLEKAAREEGIEGDVE